MYIYIYHNLPSICVVVFSLNKMCLGSRWVYIYLFIYIFKSVKSHEWSDIRKSFLTSTIRQDGLCVHHGHVRPRVAQETRFFSLGDETREAGVFPISRRFEETVS